MASSVVLVGLLVAAFSNCIVDATQVRNCKGQRHGKMLSVDISDCTSAPCILKKNTTVSIDIKFIPQNDIKRLKNHVFARLAGLPLPFIGVDGKISCNNVYLSDGLTMAGCPLKANTEYVYRNSFDVLPIYPTVYPLVHWALQDTANDNNIVCFEIQSRIVQ